jgi:hypothetical protein
MTTTNRLLLFLLLVPFIGLAQASDGQKSHDVVTVTVTASRQDLDTRAENTIDGNLTSSSRWSAKGYGQWIAYDFGRRLQLASCDIAFYRGSKRTAFFDIQISDNKRDWHTLLRNAKSSANTELLQHFEFTDTKGRYVRILGKGNNDNQWNSYTEVRWNFVRDKTPVTAAS